MKRLFSVLPLVLVVGCAMGQAYSRFSGPIQLTFSTNRVAATKGSNVTAQSSSYVSGSLYVTNETAVDAVVATLTVADTATNGATMQVQGSTYTFNSALQGGRYIAAGTNNLTSATNIYTKFAAEPFEGLEVAMTDANVLTFTATPSGNVTVTPNAAWATSANTTNSYTLRGTSPGDTIEVNGVTATFVSLVTDPATQILASTNNSDTTTNLLGWLTAYQPSASYTYGSYTTLTFTAVGDWTIGTNSDAWLEPSLTTNAVNTGVILELPTADNVTLSAFIQGDGTSTDVVIFKFVGGLDRVNWTRAYVHEFAVALNNATAVYDATNITSVGWPYLKLAQVTNSSAVNLTNFGVWYGYKF